MSSWSKPIILRILRRSGCQLAYDCPRSGAKSTGENSMMVIRKTKLTATTSTISSSSAFCHVRHSHHQLISLLSRSLKATKMEVEPNNLLVTQVGSAAQKLKEIKVKVSEQNMVLWLWVEPIPTISKLMTSMSMNSFKSKERTCMTPCISRARTRSKVSAPKSVLAALSTHSRRHWVAGRVRFKRLSIRIWPFKIFTKT